MIRGAGDLATGVAHRLYRAGFRVFMTELPEPLAVRRTVALSECVFRGKWRVEGVEAKRVDTAEEAVRVAEEGERIPVLVDPEGGSLAALALAVLVDVRMAKRNLGTSRQDAPVVIGLGPGFTAGEDAHAVVETARGHYLGQVIYRGRAQEHTGIPGEVSGFTVERVLRAPATGVLRTLVQFGDRVEAGQVVAEVTPLSPVGGRRGEPARLRQVNSVGELLVATRQDNYPVKKGELVAKAKVLGLAAKEEKLESAARLAAGWPVLEVLPFRRLAAGLVITGWEVYEGRVKDAFAPLLRRRLEEYGSQVAHVEIIPDEADRVAAAVRAMLGRGVDLVLVTGGMSPDDSTPEGIRPSGAQVAFYGVPVSPGAMTLLAYVGAVPVAGIPAGLLARPRGFFDLLLPRLLAGERLGPQDAAGYGHGGLCWACEVCVFPACPSGKGGPCPSP